MHSQGIEQETPRLGQLTTATKATKGGNRGGEEPIQATPAGVPLLTPAPQLNTAAKAYKGGSEEPVQPTPAGAPVLTPAPQLPDAQVR